MPPRSDLGERLSGLEAKVDGFERYSHDRWHNLQNTLQPLALLPAQIARDFAKLEGSIDRVVAAAVEKAIAPVIADVAELRTKVEAHDQALQRQAGAVGLLSNPIVAGIVGAIITWAMLLVAWWKGAPK